METSASSKPDSPWSYYGRLLRHLLEETGSNGLSGPTGMTPFLGTTRHTEVSSDRNSSM